MKRRPARSTLLKHPFPTRRSSDLTGSRDAGAARFRSGNAVDKRILLRHGGRGSNDMVGICAATASMQCRRSEEHTSELQSLMRNSYGVFCVKKKTANVNNRITRNKSITQFVNLLLTSTH